MVAVFLEALQVPENHASCISNPQENCTELCFHASVRQRVKTKKALCMPMGILKNGMKIIGYEKYMMEKVACWELGLPSSQKSMGKCYYPTKHCKHFPRHCDSCWCGALCDSYPWCTALYINASARGEYTQHWCKQQNVHMPEPYANFGGCTLMEIVSTKLCSVDMTLVFFFLSRRAKGPVPLIPLHLSMGRKCSCVVQLLDWICAERFSLSLHIELPQWAGKNEDYFWTQTFQIHLEKSSQSL